VADIVAGHDDVWGALLRNMRVARHCIRQRITVSTSAVNVDTRDAFPGKEYTLQDVVV
jgi:hypothetical protein